MTFSNYFWFPKKQNPTAYPELPTFRRQIIIYLFGIIPWSYGTNNLLALDQSARQIWCNRTWSPGSTCIVDTSCEIGASSTESFSVVRLCTGRLIVVSFVNQVQIDRTC